MRRLKLMAIWLCAKMLGAPMPADVPRARRFAAVVGKIAIPPGVVMCPQLLKRECRFGVRGQCRYDGENPKRPYNEDCQFSFWRG